MEVIQGKGKINDNRIRVCVFIHDYISNSGRKACCRFLCVFAGCLFSLCLLWILIVIYASPLADVEVVGISNVLGTQKELIFNLQVRAR